MTKLVIAVPTALLKKLMTLLRMSPRTLQPLTCRLRFCSVRLARPRVSSPVAASMPVWMSATISSGFCEASLKWLEATSRVHEPLALAQNREPP